MSSDKVKRALEFVDELIDPNCVDGVDFELIQLQDMLVILADEVRRLVKEYE